ncbi:CPBP family glutamic-type intramembrane protease [Nonomuraea sp. B10E15]|uniref:CPBP family glutamic-type intramembrane protease n=1 Tax=Nonomuraea sp. B10E15 TaxID=3153560 RepID=UPI00325D04F5
MRDHPLTGYFLMTFTLSWCWMALAFGVLRLPMMGVGGTLGPLIGPCLSAFVMTAVTQGRAGVLRLLRRFVLWRVSPLWYVAVLLGWPLLVVAAVLAHAGTLDVLRAPALGFGLTYLGAFAHILVLGGPLGEEPGWRGFALPGLQERIGPLLGSLLLGALHAIWHLPVFLLVPGYNGSPTDLPGMLVVFAWFTAGVTAGAVTFTWLFNNTRGSLLIAMLHHATANCVGFVMQGFFAGADVLGALGQVRAPLQIALALVVIAATRGRLSYGRHRREIGAPGTDDRRSEGYAAR